MPNKLQEIPHVGQIVSDDSTGKGVFTSTSGQSVPVTVLGGITTGGGSSATVIQKDGTDKTWLASGGRLIYRSNPVRGWRYTKNLLGPDGKDSTGIMDGAIPHAIPATQFRNSWLNRGIRYAIPPQYQPGPGAAIFKEIPQPASPSNNSQLWTFSGLTTVPQSPTGPVVVLQTFVPLHSRLRLSTFLTRLGPSVTWENNYIWRLVVGGFDIWNPFNPTPQLGRPSRADVPVQISPQLEDLPVFGPGTPIQVIVQAVAAIAANDVVSCSLTGSLWGDQ